MMKTMKSLAPFGDFRRSSAFSAGDQCGNLFNPRNHYTRGGPCTLSDIAKNHGLIGKQVRCDIETWL